MSIADAFREVVRIFRIYSQRPAPSSHLPLPGWVA